MDNFTPINLFDSSKDEASSTDEEKPMVDSEDVTEDKEKKIDENNKELEPKEDMNEDQITSEDSSTDLEGTVQNKTLLDKVDFILEYQGQMNERLNDLEEMFNRKIMHTEYEEKIVDQMHSELQKHREDMYAKLINPILLDIVEVRNSIMRLAATYLEKPEGEQDIPNKTFYDYSYDLLDILEKNSVEIYRSEPGDSFTPIKQRVIKKILTDDKSLHGKVAESLSCGYNYNGRTISAERITIYYYEEPIEKEKE